ncbi:MAG: PfkB family carbohydrate kinase [Candidatus Hadarchaeales archaeon]
MERLLKRMKGKRVLVIGDVTLDRYTLGEARNLSPEAPVPLVEILSESYFPGGIANILNNLNALGGEGRAISVVGEDAEGERLLEEMERRGMGTSGIIKEKSVPTPVIQRVITPNGHQFLRLDRTRKKLEGRTVERLVEEAEKGMGECQVILLADYGRGVITPELVGEISKVAREKGMKIIASPKKESFLLFGEADVLRTNRKEASQVTGVPSLDEAAALIMGQKLLSSVGCKAVFLTWIEGGSHLFEGEEKVSFLPALVRRPLDVTGVGDAITATLALALAAGGSLEEAAKLANYAGAIVACKKGLTTASSSELRASLREGKAFFRRMLGE